MRDQAFAWLDGAAGRRRADLPGGRGDPAQRDCDPAGSPVWRELRGTLPGAAVPHARSLHRGDRALASSSATPTASPRWTRAHERALRPRDPVQRRGARPRAHAGDRPRPVRHRAVDVVDELCASLGLAASPSSRPPRTGAGSRRPTSARTCSGSFIFQVIADVDQLRRAARPPAPGPAQHARAGAHDEARRCSTPTRPSSSAGTASIDPRRRRYYFGVSLGGIMGTMFAALTPDVRAPQRRRAGDQLLAAAPARHAVHRVPDAAQLRERRIRRSRRSASGSTTSCGCAASRPATPRTSRAHAHAAAGHEPQADAGDGRAARPAGLEPRLAPARAHAAPADARGLGAARTCRASPTLRARRTSAYVVYDTGSFDPANPAHTRFIPPLANRPARANRCDPHGRAASSRRRSISCSASSRRTA